MSNITGSSNLVDLSILVNNLQNSISNISSAFSTVQTNISNLNLYDTNNTQKINQINTLDGQQEQKLEVLKNENISDDYRIDILELKFPITNSSILNETISKQKITGLSNDLTGINTNISLLNQRITDVDNKEIQDVSTLTTNLNNQISKQAQDNTNINNSFNNLLASVPGSSNTFQQQLDVHSTNLSSLSSDNTVNKSNISSLQGDNNSNKNRITILEQDNNINKANINSLDSTLLTANTNILNNTASINTLNLNLTTLSSKEASDVASLQNQINSLSNTSGNNTSSLQTQLTNLSSKQQTDYNDLQGQITTNKNTQISDKSELNSKINDNLTTETNHYNSLSTALNALTIKEAQDVSNVQSNLTTYQASNNTRSTNIESNVSSLTIDNSNNKVDINNLKSDNNLNKANITTLQSKVSTLEADNSTNKSNITTNTNNISTINTKLITDESNITNLQQDVNNLKSYDTSNTSNINTINNTLSNHTSDINLLKNTTVPNLDNKYVFKSGDTITGTLNVNNIDASGNLNIGANANNINLGSINNNDSKVINIGGPNDTVNILGALNSIETTNTKITDKLITLNKDASGNLVGGLVGLQIRDNNNDNQGYITTNSDGSQFLIKPPQSDNIFKIKDSPNEFYDLTNKLYVDLQTSALQSSISGLTNTCSELTNQITTINNSQLDNIPFNKINAYPSTSNYILKGDGSFGKVNNNLIDNNTINPSKLVGCSGDATTFLAGDGSFKSITSGNFTSSTQVVNSNIADGAIDPLKLNGTLSSNDGLQFLSNKGTFVSISSGGCSGDTSYPTNGNFKTCGNFTSTTQVVDSNIADGSISQSKINNLTITNSNVVDGSINASKLLNYPNDNTKYLSGDGSWKVVSSGSGGSSFNNAFTANVNANNYKINNLSDPTNNQDASTKSYVDNKYLGLINTAISVVQPAQGQLGGPTFVNKLVLGSNLDLMNYNIKNVGNPVDNQDVATKNYVDSNVSYNTTSYSSYAGSLSGISCKILLVCNGNSVSATVTKLNSLITSLGGSTSNIVINGYNYNDNVTILAYDSSYDVVLYCNDNGSYPSTNTYNILNQYYNNNKGVILGSMDAYNGVSKVISNLSLQNNNNGYSFPINSSSNPIFYGVSGSILPSYFYSSFIPATNSGATSIGTYNNTTNAGLILDDNTGKGRRVDLNFNVNTSVSNDSSSNGATKIILQACLWAGRKIAYQVISSTKFDFNNPNLPSLSVNGNLSMNSYTIQNVGDPVNNQDVITKNYFNNNVMSIVNNNKTKGTLTSTSTSYIQIGNVLNGPINLIVSLVENSSVGYQLYRNYNINIYPNNADSWANTYNYFHYITGGSNNSTIAFSNGAGYSYDGIFNLQVNYGIVYIKSINTSYTPLKYYITYQY